jgi:hypothetical protein
MGECASVRSLYFFYHKIRERRLLLDKELDIILNIFGTHLKREKVFIQDPVRMAEVARALKIANKLFPDHVTEIKDDPLQTGALILCIDCTDVDASMVLNDEREIALFNEMTSLANNFEFYQINGNIRFAAVFHGALKLIN